MKFKTVLAAALSAFMLLSLFGCGEEGNGGTDDRPGYSSPAEFEGEPHDASVFFVNVGKADCAVIDIDGHAWLIDAGTDESFVNTCAALEHLGISALDGVILTHEHADHIGGLVPLSAKYPIGKAIYPEYLKRPVDITEALASASIPGMTVKVGDSIPVTAGVSFEVLAPETMDEEDDNDNSLVCALTVNGRRFLFTGDMQLSEDGRLVASGRNVLCDVLKVPNHANPDAVSAEFADAADPLISVISTDTSVDANSNSRRVRAKLSDSEIFVTQDHDLGVLITVSEKGELSVSFPARREALSGAAVTGASKSDQTVAIANVSGQSLDISGWFVYSSRGCEVFAFPQGTVIPAGGSLLIACKKSVLVSSADFVWNEKKVWAAEKNDDAVLCDPYGNEVSRLPSE